MSVTVHHRRVDIAGHSLFYREAGAADAPTIVLLHGYPTSSFMFRHLIPAWPPTFHVIAPDHLGFGLSDAPPVGRVRVHLRRPGGPHRRSSSTSSASIATRSTCRTTARPSAGGSRSRTLRACGRIVTQNGNAYEEGFVDDFWAGIWDYAKDANPDDRSRPARRLSASRPSSGNTPMACPTRPWSAPTPGATTPHWSHVRATTGSSSTLFRDYVTNVALYPAVHHYLATHESRCWLCGAATTRSSPAREPRPSVSTRTNPRST